MPKSQHIVRVAAVQLDYHPALLKERRRAISDPAFVFGERPTLLPPNGLSDRDHGQFAELESRIAGAYLDQLLKRLSTVLRTLDAWNVELVVLPEYSVPWQILKKVASIAPNMVLVAGTHFVEQDTLRTNTYAELGWAGPRPRVKEAVAPILHGGKLIGLQPKLHAAAGEDIEVGLRWDTIPLPNRSERLGVLICLDHLAREDEEFWSIVGSKIGEVNLLVVPSLTPTSSLNEFAARSNVDARRAGRPIIYTNIAASGGANIFIDDKNSDAVSVTSLPPRTEGALVADVDLSLTPLGGSTRYHRQPIIRRFAEASFVYRAVKRDAEYSNFLDSFKENLQQEDIISAVDALAAHDDLLRSQAESGPALRSKRLNILVHERTSLSNISDLQEMLREIVLTPDILPMAALQGALSEGADKVVADWALADPSAGFESVRKNLRSVASKGKSTTLTEQGSDTARSIADRVTARAKTVQLVKAASLENVYRDAAIGQLDTRREEARRLLKDGQYQAAIDMLRPLIAETSTLLEADTDSSELRKRLSRDWLALGASLLSLQRDQEAQSVLVRVEPALLEAKGFATWSLSMLQCGGQADVERALRERPAADAESLEDVRAFMEVLDENVTSKRYERPWIELRACRVLITKGDHDSAATRCFVAQDQESESTLIRLDALAVQIALAQTIIWDEPRAREEMTKTNRRELVDRIEQSIKWFNNHEETVPETWRDMAWSLIAEYLSATADVFRSKQLARRKPGTNIAPMPEDPDVSEARRLIQAGSTAEAEAILSARPPWLPAWLYAHEQHLHGQQQSALVAVRKLLETASDKFLVQCLACRLEINVGSMAGALAAALRAFDILPAHSLRLMSANCLVQEGRHDDAWNLLRDFAASDDPELLAVRATAAEHVNANEALGAWSRYLEIDPEQEIAHFRRIQLLDRLGKRSEAKKEAWTLAQRARQPSELTAEHWLMLAGLQINNTDPLDVESRRRVLEIARILRARFPNDVNAENGYFQLWLHLGQPDEMPSPEVDRLLEAKILQSVPTSELDARLRAGEEYRHAALTLYATGRITFEQLARQTSTTKALLLTRFADASANGDGPPISTPVTFGSRPKVPIFLGAHVLLGHLEILLLIRLELWNSLPSLLGESGRISILRSIREDLMLEALSFDTEHPDSELNRMKELHAEIQANATRIEFQSIDEATDEPSFATSKGVVFVEAGTAARSLNKLFTADIEEFLVREGFVSPNKHSFGEGARRLVEDALPPTLMISAGALVELHSRKLLASLLRLARSRVWISSRTWRSLLDRIADLERARRASTLAEEAHAALGRAEAAGWLEVLEDPSPILPTNRGSPVARDTIETSLRPRSALLSRPELQFVTADYVTGQFFEGGTPIELLRQAELPADEYLPLAARMRSTYPRILMFPVLARALSGTIGARELAKRLARLGFQEALRPEDLIELGREGTGLDRLSIRSLLDRSEHITRSPHHAGKVPAQVALAQNYAEVIWQTYLDSEKGNVDPRNLSIALLARCEHLDTSSHELVLNHTIEMLAAKTVSEPSAAHVPTIEGMVRIDFEQPSPRLWRMLHDWAGKESRRRGAIHRALRSAIITMDSLSSGQLPVAPLNALVAAVLSKKPSLGDTDMTSLAAAAGIWPEWPWLDENLADIRGGNETFPVSIRWLYETSAAALAANEEWIGDAILAQVDVTLPNGESAPVVVAPDVSLLYAKGEDFTTLGEQLLARLGPDDGRVIEPLRIWLASPANSDAKRAYVRATLNNAARTIREDTGLLSRWSSESSYGVDRRSRGELRVLLSEPPMSSTSEYNVVNRLQPGNSWEDRPDRATLLMRATEIPGPHAASTLRYRLRRSVNAQDCLASLRRIENSKSISVGRLSADMLFLQASAATQPTLTVGDLSIDLKETLPTIFHGLLRDSMHPPNGLLPASFDDIEPEILRLCANIVAGSGEARDYKDYLWLTWRLFQWADAQIRKLDAFERPSALLRVSSFAPGPQLERAGHDVLDPFRFAPNHLDYRTLVILETLFLFGGVLRSLVPENPVEPALASEGLSELLLQLAAKPMTDEERKLRDVEDDDRCFSGWFGPVTVPELSLACLFATDPSKFASLDDGTRLMWINDILERNREPMLVAGLAYYSAQKARALEDSESGVLREHFSRLLSSPVSGGRIADVNRMIGVAALVALMNQDPKTIDMVVELVISAVDRDRIFLFGPLIAGLSFVAKDRIPECVDRVLEAALAAKSDLALYILSLFRVVTSGEETARAEILATIQRLVEIHGLQNDPRLLSTFELFGVGGEKNA